MNPQHIRTARIVAIVADVIQLPELLALIPTGGTAGIIMIVTDLITAALLMYLLGWNWMLLPSLVAEQIPGLNLIPTWTATVFWLTRQRSGSTKLHPPSDPSKE